MTRTPAPRPAPAAVRAAPAPRAHQGTKPAPLQAPSTARFADSIALAQQRTAAAPAPEKAPAGGDGKRTFRTSDGQVVELPPDITVEEATKLEAEAKAAEKQLGKGPAPKPVPDVKKALPKAPKKEGPKAQAKGKKPGVAGGKAKAGAGRAAGRQLGAGKSKVAQYLIARGAPVLARGTGMLATLKKNEQTHDSAGDKKQQAEKAVVIPPSEGQSKSNAQQVTAVDGRPAPVADEKKARQKLQQAMADAVPQSIEEVDNFKRDRKAQHVGADVLKVVQGDSNAVVATFEDMKQTPAPAPPEHTPAALPPEEIAPPTATMNLGAGAIAPLQKEHTDVSNFTKEADGKLKEEGVTQEQLDMVDSGDLFEANKEKKGMEAKAKSEPLAIQKLAAREAESVDKDLRQDEAREREAMKAKRKEALGQTAKKQQGTKTALEKKREAVAAKINGIYKAAQDKVKKRLADLETESMRRFDEGNAAASKAFEDNVQRELAAFKSRRYSGWFGWARRAKDWLLGMDDLPEVKDIFDRNRAAFVETIDKLVAGIAADQKKVIQECKDELANAKKQISEYVESLGPDLRDIGNQAAEEMNAKLGELDQLVAKKEQELADKLKDKQAAAIKAIDEKIEKMKEEMSGALSKLGKLLLLAAKKFFTWALEKFGMSLSTIESIINKGAAVLKAIFTGPIQFVKNLVRAASTGFENFGKNFLTHLKNALFEWLTGSLQGLVLPKTWDLKGILSVVFQMLGITYANFRSHLVKLIPEPVVKGLETTFELVKTLVTEGPMAAWEQLKEIAGEIKDAFVEAVKDWIKWKVVQKAIETVLSIFIPGAGIIRAIVAIYDTVVFFIQKAKDIIQMVGRFLDSIAEIAAGNIGAAASALEAGLARALVLVIDFLARFLRLSGITKKIQEAIAKVRGKVDGVMGKVAAWVAAQVKKVGAAVVGGARSAARRVAGWLGLRKEFRAGTETHSLSFQRDAANPTLILASTPEHILTWLNRRRGELTSAGQYDSSKKAADQAIQRDVRAVRDLTYPREKAAPPTDPTQAVQALLDQISANVAILGFGALAPVPPMVVTPGFSSQKAGNMTVQFLFIDRGNHRAGTPTTGREDLLGAWPVLTGMGISRHYWKSGHMLNVTFGGQATNSNLIPIPTQVNRAQEATFDSRVQTNLYEKRKVIFMRFTVQRNHPEEQTAPHPGGPHFVSHFKAEAGEMPWNNGRYEPPGSMQYTFEKSGADLPYPVRPTTAVGLNAVILAGDTSRDAIRAAAQATQLEAQLIEGLVRRGTALASVDDIEAFIQSKRAEYGDLRATRYLSNLQRVKGGITL